MPQNMLKQWGLLYRDNGIPHPQHNLTPINNHTDPKEATLDHKTQKHAH